MVPTKTNPRLSHGTYDTSKWVKFRGADLDVPLRSSAIALLDAKWLVDHADAGGTVVRRQELPGSAFVSFEDLQAMPIANHGLRIIAVSYPWLTPDNPDPKGVNLRLVAHVLKAYLARWGGRWAVLWDFMSLHQHPPGGLRNASEDLLFKQALGALGFFYAHKFVTVFMLTRFPAGYPAQGGYVLPEGANVAMYADRGWCYCESSLASLTKDFYLTLDLGRLPDEACLWCRCVPLGRASDYDSIVSACTMGGGRMAPVPPNEFAKALECKTFTNGKEDRPVVTALQAAAYEWEFRMADELHYENLGWGDLDAIKVAKAVAALPANAALEALFLAENKIGDVAAAAIAAMLRELKCSSLVCLNLSGNLISDMGAAEIGEALATCRAPLQDISLDNNRLSEAAKDSLREAAKAVPSLSLEV